VSKNCTLLKLTTVVQNIRIVALTAQAIIALGGLILQPLGAFEVFRRSNLFLMKRRRPLDDRDHALPQQALRHIPRNSRAQIKRTILRGAPSCNDSLAPSFLTPPCLLRAEDIQVVVAAQSFQFVSTHHHVDLTLARVEINFFFKHLLLTTQNYYNFFCADYFISCFVFPRQEYR
jgi:hypothetical protein